MQFPGADTSNCFVLPIPTCLTSNPLPSLPTFSFPYFLFPQGYFMYNFFQPFSLTTNYQKSSSFVSQRDKIQVMNAHSTMYIQCVE